MKTKVVANKNLPVPMPLQFSLICYLLLDKFQAAGWAWGAVGVILALLWIVYFIAIFSTEQVDLFKGK